MAFAGIPGLGEAVTASGEVGTFLTGVLNTASETVLQRASTAAVQAAAADTEATPEIAVEALRVAQDYRLRVSAA